MNIRVTVFDPAARRSIEDEIERLLALLDALDGDADFEHGEMDSPGFIWGGGEDGGPAHSGC